jgi:hypothetical protein
LLSQPHELRGPTVISDEVGGETLAINLESGAYFVISPASLAIWSALTTGVPAMALLEGATDPRQPALEAFLTKLLNAGLLRPVDSPSEPGEMEPWFGEDLEIQEFTDMADLLGLDPIHDVDEALGWPSKPSTD